MLFVCLTSTSNERSAAKCMHLNLVDTGRAEAGGCVPSEPAHPARFALLPSLSHARQICKDIKLQEYSEADN